MARRYKDFDTALLAYRNRPEGPIEPVKTNWSVVPANDNADPDELAALHIERRLEIVPSLQAIVAEMRNEPQRNDAGQVIAIGALRFSDGTQTERAHTFGPEGKLIQFDARLPVGAMLHTSEKQAKESGGCGETRDEVAASNKHFAEMLGTAPYRHVSGKRDKKRGRLYTSEQSKAMLAEAYANTPVLPPVTYCKPGLPCGGSKVADSFVGMRKAAKGQGGSIAWEDIASAKIHREVWAETVAYLSKEDVETLDAAMEAKTLSDIAPGGSKRGARKRGKRRLVAANDNLRTARHYAE